jgi:hypothetical protein
MAGRARFRRVCDARRPRSPAWGDRARVTQVLGLLEFQPEVVQALAALGDPLPKPMVTERKLRAILKLSSREQKLAMRGIVELEATR